MTPFGDKVRQIRRQQGISLKDMAESIRVSSAYLSALEHGKRGTPTLEMVNRISDYLSQTTECAAELKELARVSNPRIVIDTAGLDPKATEFTNRLATSIHAFDRQALEELMLFLKKGVIERRA